MAGIDTREAKEPRTLLVRLVDGSEWKISERHCWRIQQGVMNVKHPRRAPFVVLENHQGKTFAVRLAVGSVMWWSPVPDKKEYADDENDEVREGRRT